MRVSIITVCYNSAKTIEQTIRSVFSQDYPQIEYIVIDGQSQDKTLKAIAPYQKQLTHLVSEKDTGIYDAWNKGLKKVSSSWIAFLGSDDTYYPNALEIYKNEIYKNPKINYISSQVEYINTNQKVLKIIGKPYNYNQMNRYMNIAHVGSFHHKNLFVKHGNFNTDYKIVADYDFFMKCGLDIQSGYFESITAKMLNSGISNQNITTVFNEVLKIQLAHKKISKLQAYFEYYYNHIRIYKSRLAGKSSF